MSARHVPVLVEAVVHGLADRGREGLIIVDGTVGGGGHAKALAERIGPGGRVIGLDRDPAMLELARREVAGLPVTLFHAAYRQIGEVLDELQLQQVDGILLDLGLSSDQLAWSERGFSFAVDGPLDMRFDSESGGPTAADLVASSSEFELARIFHEYGEERFSRRIARRIVENRRASPIATTSALADLVRRCVPRAKHAGAIDPATRVFQALRIAVNDELAGLDFVLERLAGFLAPEGRAAVISFHSLEDRRVKWAFRNDPRLTVLTKKPVTALAQEMAVNPRARSAKLRVVERCPNQSSSSAAR